MFLNKREARPIENGSFCTLKENIKIKIKKEDHYHRHGNPSGDSWSTSLHIADTDLLYVIDDSYLDVKGLAKVIVLKFEFDNGWLGRVNMSMEKKKYFIISIKNLNKINSLANGIHTLKEVRNTSIKHIFDRYNSLFDLHKRKIPLRWDDN